MKKRYDVALFYRSDGRQIDIWARTLKDSPSQAADYWVPMSYRDHNIYVVRVRESSPDLFTHTQGQEVRFDGDTWAPVGGSSQRVVSAGIKILNPKG